MKDYSCTTIGKNTEDNYKFKIKYYEYNRMGKLVKTNYTR